MSEDRLRQIRSGFADDASQDEGPPDLGPLPGLAEREELADAARCLAGGYGRPLRGSWTPHNLLSLDWGRWLAYQGTRNVMNGALSEVLDALGFQVSPSGVGGAWIVTGRRPGRAASADLDQISVPRRPGPDGAYQPVGQQAAARSAPEAPARTDDSEDQANLAAVAAYRASMENGTPLSEGKLAAMFGKTSRRWARSRMTEATTRSTVGTAQSH
jgi:hypothetical protein